MADLYEELQAEIGKETPLVTGPYEVNKAMIGHWCEAMENGNPMYTDEEYARKSKYGGIIAPPEMMQTYIMAPIWPKKELPGGPGGSVLQKLDEAGYTAVIATNTAQEYFRPLYLGDRVSCKSKIISVSPEKTTRVGKGYFVTWEYSYFNQKGELIGKQPFTVLKFKPAEAPKE